MVDVAQTLVRDPKILIMDEPTANLDLVNELQVLELVKAFEAANEMKLPYVIGPRRDGDLPAFWADATKAKELLGWEATHTVEDMCRSSWEFAKNSK